MGISYFYNLVNTILKVRDFMAKIGSVYADPLFIGLTRPAMLFGVSYTFAMLYMIICVLYYIQFPSINIILFGIGCHIAGYIACFKEPLFIELFLIKFQKTNICKNKLFHGANSYDVY